MAGITYQMAGANWRTELQSVMEKYHGPLHENGVKVDILLAKGPTDEDGENIGPAVKHHGRTCYAKVRIIGLKDRAAGRGDAEIILDGDHCDTWSQEQAEAILDHELTHLELQTFEDGALKRDDLDRPKLRIRPHDREFGWFDSVARRHGQHAVEVQQAQEMLGDHVYRQLYLPGMDLAELAEQDGTAVGTQRKRQQAAKRQAAMSR